MAVSEMIESAGGDNAENEIGKSKAQSFASKLRLKVRNRKVVSAQSLVNKPSLTLGERAKVVGRGFRKTARVAGRTSDFIETSRFSPLSNKFKDSSKMVQKRSVGTQRLLKAIGAIPNRSGAGGGRGRPRGTYKYGIPIQQYKKLQAERSALYKQYAQQQNNQLASRGLTPQQVQQLQIERTAGQPVQQFQQPKPMPVQSAADDELEFQKFLAENTVSPNTQQILDNLKRIQNKAITDDINQQRVHRERLMVNQQQSLLKARNLFGPDSNKINIFDDTGNPLKAENMFALARQENVFAPSGRPTLLQTQQTGNTFNAFREDRPITGAPNMFSKENAAQHTLRFFG